MISSPLSTSVFSICLSPGCVTANAFLALITPPGSQEIQQINSQSVNACDDPSTTLAYLMAAVITVQSSPNGRQTAPSAPFQSQGRQQSGSTPALPLAPSSAVPRDPANDGSSCDACLRRKSRCAMNKMANKCYSCEFHRQECIFSLSANRPGEQSKKRKLEETSPEDVESKR